MPKRSSYIEPGFERRANMENSSILNMNEACNEDDKQSETGTFFDVVTTDVFPWNRISRHCSNEVNRCARFLGDLSQTTFLLVAISLGVFGHQMELASIATIYQVFDESFLTRELNCSRYYRFDLRNFSFQA